MKRGAKARVLALVSSIALLGGTAVVASGSTGAYFSDTHNGSISGTIGSILVSTDSPTSIGFSNLLPGVPQTVQVNYHNSGTSPEDVYLAFPNATALSALNNLGRYGSVQVSSAGGGSVGSVFTSYNLDDNSTSCGPFSNAIPSGSNSGCWPLTSPLLLASNVQPGWSENFTFTFEYASALTGNGPGVWNQYPLAGGVSYSTCIANGGTHDSCSNNQFTVNGGDGSGDGLPYQLIATQVGVTPGQVGTKF